MSYEERWKRLIFKWTAPKGFAAMVLFLILSSLTEYSLVSFFLSLGLTDKSLLTGTIWVPLTGLSFTLTISPLFHLIPFGVIVVLASSWMHLTKYAAVVPRRMEPIKKPSIARKVQQVRTTQKRFKSIKRFYKRMGKKFQRIGWALTSLYRRAGAAILRVRGISYLTQRLFFAKAAIKSTAAILTVFVVSFFALCALGYPRLIYDATTGFYGGNPSFHRLVLQTFSTAQAIGQALPPIWWLASAINNALLAAAPAFRGTIENSVTPITAPVVKLDLVWKYAICQNIAAWISTFAALEYGWYTSRLYRRPKPR
ncbi:MAG: hypothetical protein AOA65_0797 [Candidatus Bathyarchaeota archaeon BA1]|nr:MAG: hypothetical protein AOA65_0797 [Candidatus Bathyarchaeota archaeon BA1]